MSLAILLTAKCQPFSSGVHARFQPAVRIAPDYMQAAIESANTDLVSE